MNIEDLDPTTLDEETIRRLAASKGIAGLASLMLEKFNVPPEEDGGAHFRALAHGLADLIETSMCPACARNIMTLTRRIFYERREKLSRKHAH
jgi:hypothetical protein